MGRKLAQSDGRGAERKIANDKKGMKQLRYIFFLILLAALQACNGGKTVRQAEAEETATVGLSFNEDSAYFFCEQQCAFGPRTMNSAAHDECEAWIIQRFRQYGCEVTTQKANLKGWDGTTLRSTNIIARTNPSASRRIIICAHWDSRPWADNDPDSANWRKPVMGANDGASGVAVMLELARCINGSVAENSDFIASDSLKLNFGIDFVCFDAEDYGTPEWAGRNDSEDTWALGAQHFAANLPATAAEGGEANAAPYSFGILLDMVGGQGAHFYHEGLSKYYAPDILAEVWQAACHAGYSSFFLNQDGGTVTDDHKPLNEAGIPTIDIIAYYPDCQQSGFGPTWHTVTDDMQHIDRNTLKAVGQTLVQFLYGKIM